MNHQAFSSIKRSKKVLMVTMHYFPEPNFVTKDIADQFSDSGHDVTVITGFPNYPLGRFYDSVKSIWPKVEYDGKTRIIRLPLFPDRSLSKIRRFFSYLSFTFAAALVVPFVFRPSVAFIYQTPFTVGLVAILVKLLYRTKVYYISADLWPESFEAAGVTSSSPLLKILYYYSRFINRRADFLVCSTNGIAKRYIQDGISPDKVCVVPVWVDIPKNPAPDNYHKKISEKRVVYAGNLGAAQGLEVVVKAAAICYEKDPSITFHLYGIGTEYERLLMLSANMPNVFFHGRVSPEEAFEACRNALINVVHLKKSPQFQFTLPSKLAMSLAAGGVLLSGVEGEAQNLVETSKVGFTFTPENPSELSEKIFAILKMEESEIEQLSKRSVRFFDDTFSKNKLLFYYNELIESEHTQGLDCF